MEAEIYKLLKFFCWDVDINKVDLDKHKKFIIERILQYGRPKEVNWVLEYYTDEDIINVVKCSKNIDRKTANFWMIHYNIPKEDVLCLNRQLIHKCFY